LTLLFVIFSIVNVAVVKGDDEISKKTTSAQKSTILIATEHEQWKSYCDGFKRNDPAFVDVKLRRQYLAPVHDLTDMKILAESLRENTHLKMLDISLNNFGDENMRDLSELLKVNTALQHLILHKNRMTHMGVAELSPGLKGNKHLLTLDLSANRVGTEGAEFFAKVLEENNVLQTLDLRGNRILDKGMQYLSYALETNTGLKRLELGEFNRLTSVGANFLATALKKKNTGLEILNLPDGNIGDEGARFIAEALKVNKHLKSMNLDWNNINDLGGGFLIKALRENTVIQQLKINSVSENVSNQIKLLLKNRVPETKNEKTEL